MRICGLQKLSMVDYPGKLAATVFTGGCNLRCPFCHNALLVTRLEESPILTEDEVMDFLKKRRGLLDGVVLSGGEPLMHPGAADFLAAVRDMGFAVKLDTNGFYPQQLAHILDRKLADYVAMDIKNRREKYGLTCGLPDLDPAPVEESLRFWQPAVWTVNCAPPWCESSTPPKIFRRWGSGWPASLRKGGRLGSFSRNLLTPATWSPTASMPLTALKWLPWRNPYGPSCPGPSCGAWTKSC